MAASDLVCHGYQKAGATGSSAIVLGYPQDGPYDAQSYRDAPYATDAQ